MMKDVSILFCPTVPHTGTTFIIRFFKGDPAIKSFQSLSFLKRFHGDWFVPGLNLVHAHFDEDLFDLIIQFKKKWPIVVSLRDPLLSVLTKHYRGTKIESPVGCFVKLVEMIDLTKTAYKPIYLPVDLMTQLPVEKRIKRFVGALEPLKFLDKAHCLYWAREWPYVASKGDSRRSYYLKDLYHNHEAKAIKKIVPEEWAALEKARPLLQPFLEARGYRDLLWWAD